MKYIFFVIILIELVSGCEPMSDTQSASVPPEQNDRLVALHSAVSAFEKDVKTVEDSVKKYGMQSLRDSCLKYLYVLYCQKTFSDKIWCGQNTKSIGECRIAASGFNNVSSQKKEIRFAVFLNDSIPCSVELDNVMISGFIVEPDNSTISEALYGQHARNSFQNIKTRYDIVISSNSLIEYVKKYRATLHPEFKRLL